MKNWYYEKDARASKRGRMICEICGKSIHQRAYRYYETEEAYISQHRECSLDDPEWKKIDRLNEKAYQHSARLLAACLKFKNYWNVDALDGLIDELKEPIKRY